MAGRHPGAHSASETIVVSEEYSVRVCNDFLFNKNLSACISVTVNS